jgi:hypothetical protein
MFQYYDWQEVDINWEAVDMNWEEVGIVVNDVIPYVSPPIAGKPREYKIKEINDLDKEKKRKIIKLVCKIKGEDDEYISYKYKNEDITITAEDIDIIVDELTKNIIKVNVQNIS